MKIAYLDFSVVNPTLFKYVDKFGNEQEEQFDPQEPQECIKSIATLIQLNGIEKVICNKIGYGLCGSISQQLKTSYGNNNCYFELND